MASRRLTTLQTEELRLVYNQLGTAIEENDSAKLELARAQLESFLREEGYRRQHHDVDLDLGHHPGGETR